MPLRDPFPTTRRRQRRKSAYHRAMAETIFGQPSWRLETREVTAFITELGGHVGPVTFRLGDREIQPFSIAPWYDEEIGDRYPGILRVLRGDFFCLPFGANWTEFNGEKHELHG